LIGRLLVAYTGTLLGPLARSWLQIATAAFRTLSLPCECRGRLVFDKGRGHISTSKPIILEFWKRGFFCCFSQLFCFPQRNLEFSVGGSSEADRLPVAIATGLFLLGPAAAATPSHLDSRIRTSAQPRQSNSANNSWRGFSLLSKGITCWLITRNRRRRDPRWVNKGFEASTLSRS